ncbi:MAG: hypothetical protein AAFY20_22630 [Cyanobacteria bacterium J06639_14]
MKLSQSPSPFKLIFIAVLSLTLTSGGMAVHLASQPTLTESQERVLNSAIAMWTMGTSTMIGLLSHNRPAASDNEDDDQG